MGYGSQDMKYTIEKLLESKITAYKIGKEAGVQDSLVKKLRSGEQKIGDTKFSNLEILYNYAMDHSTEVFHIGGDSETKLPKNVVSFIDDLKNILKYINNRSIDNVYVYDKYQLDEKGNSETKISYIEIDEDVPIPLNGQSANKSEWIPYKISIKSKIDNRKDINEIHQVRIILDSEKLINDLKAEVRKGNKLKVKSPTMFSSNKSKTLYVYDVRENTETWGYETDYFNIQYNSPLKQGGQK